MMTEFQADRISPTHYAVNNTSNVTGREFFQNITDNFLDGGESDYGAENDLMTMSKVFELYVMPFLILIGAIGNILVMVTARQKNLGNWSICFYLAAYACGNILILVPMAGMEWLCKVAGWKYVALLTDWTCKLWQFLERVVVYSGAWFVVAMMIDQYIAIWHPLKAVSMCTVFMAKFATVMIIVGLVVISIHAIWTFELFPNGCYISHKPNDLLALIWPWASLSLYCIIPFVLLCILAVMVTYGVFTKHTWKKSPSNYQVPIDVTLMTIILAVTFVLFATPATITHIINISLPTAWLQNPDFVNQFKIAQVVSTMLVFLNPSLSFVVCFAFSSTLRTELKEMLRSVLCKTLPRVYEMQVNSNSSATQMEYEVCSETTPL